MNGPSTPPAFDLAPLRLQPGRAQVQQVRRGATPGVAATVGRVGWLRPALGAVAALGLVALVAVVVLALVTDVVRDAVVVLLPVTAATVVVSALGVVLAARAVVSARWRHHARWDAVARASGAEIEVVAAGATLPVLVHASDGPLGPPPWSLHLAHRDVLRRRHGTHEVLLGTRQVRGRKGPHGVRRQTMLWAAVAVAPGLPAAYLHLGRQDGSAPDRRRIVSRDATHTLYAGHDHGVTSVVTERLVDVCTLDRPRVAVQVGSGWLVLAALGGAGSGHASRVVEALDVCLETLEGLDRS